MFKIYQICTSLRRFELIFLHDLSEQLAILVEFQLFPQKMTIWVGKAIRIGAVRVYISVDVKNIPAMAVVWQSAGPAWRPAGGL